jgi:hypothetical protein
VRVGDGHKEHGHKNGVSFRIHGLYCGKKKKRGEEGRGIGILPTWELVKIWIALRVAVTVEVEEHSGYFLFLDNCHDADFLFRKNLIDR